MSGPLTGGTSVTVSGANFINGTTCRFGETSTVIAMYTSSTQIICVSPVASAGSVVLEASNNNRDFTNFGRQFQFYSML